MGPTHWHESRLNSSAVATPGGGTEGRERRTGERRSVRLSGRSRTGIACDRFVKIHGNYDDSGLCSSTQKYVSSSETNSLLSSPIKYPTFGSLCQHFPLLHLLTFLHHRQHLQISLRSGLQPNQKSIRFFPTVPTSNLTLILFLAYPPGSSKNVHQSSFPQSRISSNSLWALVSFILFSSNQPFSRNPPWTSYPVTARSPISKIIERVVKSRLTDYLSSNNNSSPPTVNTIPLKLLLSKPMTISLTQLDHTKISCLCLLDLSAAFNTVDHDILITRLLSWFGIHGSVLNWFKSYLSSRSFRVKCSNSLSSSRTSSCGVP